MTCGVEQRFPNMHKPWDSYVMIFIFIKSRYRLTSDLLSQESQEAGPGNVMNQIGMRAKDSGGRSFPVSQFSGQNGWDLLAVTR
jgi:hypothetical protein